MYRKRAEGWVKHLDFILWDILCLHIAFIVSYMLRHGISSPYMEMPYRKIAIIYTMADLVVNFCYGTMTDVLKRGYYKELVITAFHVFLVEAFIVFYLFAMKEGAEYSRAFMGYFFLLYFLFSYATRLLWKKHIANVSFFNNSRSMLVIATYNDAVKFVEHVLEKEYGIFRMAGFIILDQDMVGERIGKIPVIADLPSMISYICHEWVDEIFIINPKEDPTTTDLLNQCIQMGLTVHIKIDEMDGIIGGKQIMEKLGDDYTVVTASMNVISYREEISKRILDILGSLVGCFITMILTVLIGPVIYVKSPGPIFFAQDRVGRNGKIFKMYKFRSMYMDAEERKQELMEQNRVKDGMMFKLDWDPRIIGSKQLSDGRVKKGIGNFIRDWSLDEFPQFFNVLKGDMSLVGTRPPTLDEWQKYEPHHRARLSI